jgi:hypothetical protein
MCVKRAQVASAIGTVGLTVLFGFQLRVFYRQVLGNRDTLNEMRESRTAHECPHVLVTAEYRHGTLVGIVVSNIGRGAAENITFEFSAPLESSVSYQRDSEVVPLSELPHFRVTAVWDSHANLVPLLREMGLYDGITATIRYGSLTGESYETLWTINPLLMLGNLYAAESGEMEE